MNIINNDDNIKMMIVIMIMIMIIEQIVNDIINKAEKKRQIVNFKLQNQIKQNQ